MSTTDTEPGDVRLFDPDPPRQRRWTDDLHEQPPEGAQRRAEGEADARDGVSPSWRRDAEQTIDQLAASGRTFTAEDVRAEVGDPLGPSSNSLGALIAAASRAGTIEAVGYTTATRAEAHGRVIREWRGTP